MSEVYIAEVLQRLNDSRATARKEALDQLKNLLKQRQSTGRSDFLQDEGFYEVYEALFRCVKTERATYTGASKSTKSSTTAATNRLKECASTFRLAVELGVTSLTSPTANAVLDHVVDTLQVPGGEYCAPLTDEYLRVLRIVVSHAAHVEHLRPTRWGNIVDFLLQGISKYIGDADVVSSDPAPASASPFSRSEHVASFRVSQSSGSRGTRLEPGRPLEELILCLDGLTGVSNSPIMSRATEITQCLQQVLNLAISSASVLQAAFKCINNVLAVLITEQTAVAKEILIQVVSVARRLWSSKNYLLRDEMLITLALGSDTIHGLSSSEITEDLQSSLWNLSETMSMEYGRRSEKDMLQLDEVMLGRDHHQQVMSLERICIRPEHVRATYNWSTLSVLASINIALYSVKADNNRDGTEESRVKRRRVMTVVDEILEQALSESLSNKIRALQLIPFLHSRTSGIADIFIDSPDRFLSQILDEDTTIAAWTMTALASLVPSQFEGAVEENSPWVKVWHSASRNLSNPAISRFAAHLLNTLLQSQFLSESDATKLTETTLFSNGLNGPVGFSDAALQLWTTILGPFGTQHQTVSSKNLFRFVNWLSSYYQMTSVVDRATSKQLALYATPSALLGVVCLCIDVPPPTAPENKTVISSAIYIAAFNQQRNEGLRKYLLHQVLPARKPSRISQTPHNTSEDRPARREEHDRAFIELLLSKIQSFKESWVSLAQQRASNINSDVIQIVSSLVMVSTFLPKLADMDNSKLCQDLHQASFRLWDQVCRFVGASDDSQSNYGNDAAMVLMSSNLSEPQILSPEHFSALASSLLVRLNAKPKSGQNGGSADVDFLDVEGSFASMTSQNAIVEAASPDDRHDLPFVTSESVLSKVLRLYLLTTVTPEDAANLHRDHKISPVVEYVSNLSPEALVASRLAIVSTLNTLDLSRADLSKFLRAVAVACIESYEFERSEGSLCLVLEVMMASAETWTAEEDDALHKVAAQVYRWLVSILLAKRLGCSRVLIRLAHLLTKVIGLDPTYGGLNLPSSRTSLFEVMRDGNNAVKFHIAGDISSVFGRFVLTEHEAILNEVVQSLPNDTTQPDGIAMRLYILTELASRWTTLLRTSIYHLFEAAAHIATAVDHAKSCLESISAVVKVSSSRELFLLFAPQLLYTWLESGSIASIPFAIFHFPGLKELLQAVQSEVISQAVMRSQMSSAKEIASILGQPLERIMEESFAKTEAYSIAHDISMPPVRDQPPKSAESQIRKLLGAEKYLELLSASFPEVVAVLFLAFSEEQDMSKAFSNRIQFGYAAANLTAVTTLSSSNTALQPGQQPSFRVKYLIHELEFLCRRIDVDLASIWEPRLVVFLYRTLLDSIVPSLGSLHACLVLRKIRIVVCLASEECFAGYPLEMLLRALQPFLIQTYCAEDALGIFWYLLKRGKAHLEKHPSFLCATALNTLLSLNKFLVSPPDNTTQAAQHRSTVSGTEKFIGWFGEYLINISHRDNEEGVNTFTTIIKLAREARPPGRAEKETSEGKLLLELLEARTTDNILLTEAAFHKALSIFCHPFVCPSTPQHDILGGDELAARHAEVLWTLLQQIDASTEFRTWAGEALGRAYAASGVIAPALTQEYTDDPTTTDDETRIVKSSQALLLEELQKLLHHDDAAVVSLAEKALGQILTALDEKDLAEYRDSLVPSLESALNWQPENFPTTDETRQRDEIACQERQLDSKLSVTEWASFLLTNLAVWVENDAFLDALPMLLFEHPSLAIDLMPLVVHIYLQADNPQTKNHRRQVSAAFKNILVSESESSQAHKALVIRTIFYLRCQPLPREVTIEDRIGWLDLDLLLAAEAATACSMHKSALLLLEIHNSTAQKTSRRASQGRTSQGRSSQGRRTDENEPSVQLFRKIYQHLDDPDSFYGIQEEASLESVMRQLDHEGDGRENLAFQTALMDAKNGQSSGLMDSLVSANMNGIAMAVQHLANDHNDQVLANQESVSAITLHKWDLPVLPSASCPASLPLSVFRLANSSPDLAYASLRLNSSVSELTKSITKEKPTGPMLHQSMASLAVLSEIKELFSVDNRASLESTWRKLERREDWQGIEDFERISLILSAREAFFSTIKDQPVLSEALHLSVADCRVFEAHCLRHSLKQARSHGSLQAALNKAVRLSTLADQAETLGIFFGEVVAQDFASVLWDHGNMSASIQMLKQLNTKANGPKQSIPLSRSALLTDMGTRIAEARLERPDEINDHYLEPAIKALGSRGDKNTKEAGRVYHEFASFCDQQLHNPESALEFERVRKAAENMEKDLADLQSMARGRQKKESASYLIKAKSWLDLERKEFGRLQHVRETFLRSTLENYLLSLRVCDDYANDALRFCAIWLDHSDNENVQEAIRTLLTEVASRKFAPMMNQLSSRLLDTETPFQVNLFDLLHSICTDHPFHGMYQVFSTSKNRGARDDEAVSRHAAAGKLAQKLLKGKQSSIWVALHNSNISFIRVATDRLAGSKPRSGAKILLSKTESGAKMEEEIAAMSRKIPPPTLHIPIRLDCDYSDIPVLVGFDPTFTVAGGLSAPKIITMLSSSGARMRALLKGGNDDLRQDSIMEQVFEQVSNLLRMHRTTRQRQLAIRTYKVLPLMMNAGIIEFVPNTTPLHEFSLPAHAKYHPRDWKPKRCRDEISASETGSLADRVRALRLVTSNFQPVLRHFFFERFRNPDEWFQRRLAYTRSTAAISILGHILGLGDRHGHNILLDEFSGEAVHIDLGVAFEAGRILPVPEVVPFRLTRDVVDGMGVAGVEGVFRRCCNFTLEALRQEVPAIMTILDVLRYDPLYSWSVSPLRLQRMQEDKRRKEKEAEAGIKIKDGDGEGGGETGAATAGAEERGEREAVNNPSEADRALAVVARKLGKGLSVEATVNGLIQQAMDERNLAVLYYGWAAFA